MPSSGIEQYREEWETYWRKRAQRARERAGRISIPEPREMMLELASIYDRVAAHLDAPDPMSRREASQSGLLDPSPGGQP